MRKLILTLTVAAVAFASTAVAQGTRLDKLDAVKWYNTPPLALEQLHGKAVLFEVFRTW